MPDKYLHADSGVITEREAIDSSAGAGNAGDIVALDSGGLISPTMLPGEAVLTIVASENLAAGDLVNIWNDGGTIKARKADATATGKEAWGFVNAAVTATNNATVFATGSNTGVSGLTIGSEYYLDTTAGGITTTAPSASGNVVQSVGIAIAATELLFTRGDIIVKA